MNDSSSLAPTTGKAGFLARGEALALGLLFFGAIGLQSLAAGLFFWLAR